MITKAYLWKVLHGGKLLLNNSELKPKEFPRYPEFTTKKLMKEVREDAAINKYFPDDEDMSRPMCRKWAWNVMNTLKPGFCDLNYRAARDARATRFSTKINPDAVNIPEEWVDLLLKFPMKPGKNQLHLLDSYLFL